MRVLRVLLVDDVEQTRRAMVRKLKQHGIDAIEAASALETLEKLAGGEFDVLVTDWCLGQGEMDGISLARAVRERAPKLPILLYSGRPWSSAERAAALDAGIDDVMLDPLDGFVELASRVRALRRRASGMMTTRLRVGAVEIDPTRRRVTVNGIPTELTHNDYTLLERLASQSPDVVTKEELYGALGYPKVGQSHALRQAIARLRGRLGPAADHIQAVSGVGYRFSWPSAFNFRKGCAPR